MKLALGTVQFGLKYGIANAAGRTPDDEVARILEDAGRAGIDTLDTAAAYGQSEEVLGRIGVREWRVISKVPPMPEGITDVRGWVRQQVRRSLVLLRVERLTGLLLHKADDLLGSRGVELAAGLRAVQDEGLVDKVGVSIYGPHALPELTRVMQPDLVQAPFNAIDQRLLTSGWLSRLADAGVEVHARSVFLQGLLLMNPVQRPAAFDRWDALWHRWDAAVEAHGGSALSVCLGVVAAQPSLSRIVVGVEHQAQLRQLLTAWQGAVPVRTLSGVASEDPMLVEPFNWAASK